MAAIDIKALTTDKSDLNRDLKQDLISRHTDEGKISAKIREHKSYEDDGNVMSKPGLSHRMPDSQTQETKEDEKNDFKLDEDFCVTTAVKHDEKNPGASMENSEMKEKSIYL